MINLIFHWLGKFRDYFIFICLPKIVQARLRGLGVQIYGQAQFLGMPIVSMEKGGRIEVHDGVVLCSMSTYTALGICHPVVLRTIRPGASISIGSNTGISGASICAATSVTIGQDVLLGANVTITDTDFHAIKPDERRYNNNPVDIPTAPVVISNNVFIGAGSYILKGVEIGENSIIGAGSVVTKSIPSNVIAAGNPAKVIKIL